jgi:VWFA-related protein
MKDLRAFYILSAAAALVCVRWSEAPTASFKAQKQEKALQYEVRVTLKLVQVYVTDKDGRSVTDLTVGDFELLDNGRPREITAFEKHLLPESEKTQAGETKIVPTAAPARLNRKFFLLFDLVRNDSRGLATAKTAALDFVEKQLLPTDEVAILSLSPLKGWVVHSYLTIDHERAEETIRKLKAIPIYGGGEGLTIDGEAGEDEGFLELLGEKVPPGELQEFLKEFQSVRREDKWRALSQYSKDLAELARGLRYLQGNKNIIFFSRGIPSIYLTPVEDQKKVFQESTEVIPPDYSPVVQSLFQDMIKEFAASGSPVFAINTEGARTYFKGREERGSNSLKQFSEESGGTYFDDVDKYETISQSIQNITGNYYVLGYSVDQAWDGKFHEITVRVKKKGFEIHGQPGYFNPIPFRELSSQEKKLLLLDLVFNETPRSQDPARFALMALPCPDTAGTNCVLMAEIDLERLEGAASPKSEIVSAIFDTKGGLVESRQGELDFNSLPGPVISHYSLASLPAGDYTCRTIIRNPETGKAAAGSCRVTVPGLSGPGVTLWPPLLLLPGKKVHYLKSVEKSKSGGQQVSLKDLYPLIPAEAGPVVAELKAGAGKLLAVLPCEMKNIASPNLEISAFLKDAALQEEIPLTYKVISFKKDGARGFFLLELEWPQLMPGDYTLTMILSELTSLIEAEVTRIIRIITLKNTDQ